MGELKCSKRIVLWPIVSDTFLSSLIGEKKRFPTNISLKLSAMCHMVF